MPSMLTIAYDVGQCVTYVLGIATILRMPEVIVFIHPHVWKTAKIAQQARIIREKDLALESQHRTVEGLEDGLRFVRQEVADLQRRANADAADRIQLRRRIEAAEERLDGAVAYARTLMAWGLRLLKQLKIHNIHVGIDENLPAPPDVLLEFVHLPPTDPDT